MVAKGLLIRLEALDDRTSIVYIVGIQLIHVSVELIIFMLFPTAVLGLDVVFSLFLPQLHTKYKTNHVDCHVTHTQPALFA